MYCQRSYAKWMDRLSRNLKESQGCQAQCSSVCMHVETLQASLAPCVIPNHSICNLQCATLLTSALASPACRPGLHQAWYFIHKTQHNYVSHSIACHLLVGLLALHLLLSVSLTFQSILPPSLCFFLPASPHTSHQPSNTASFSLPIIHAGCHC